jgi:hypothetical protein
MARVNLTIILPHYPIPLHKYTESDDIGVTCSVANFVLGSEESIWNLVLKVAVQKNSAVPVL